MEARVRQLREKIDQNDAEAELLELRRQHYMQFDHNDTRTDTTATAEANGGVIDGGTWEHRKRSREMLETAEANYKKTREALKNSGGRSHIGSYIPKDVLSKFLADAAKKSSSSGNSPTFQVDNAVKKSNIGYQMLEKSGWQQGEGLGTGGAGRKAPIVPSVSGSDRKGIGTKATYEVEAGDDEYDLFRKRMQLSYRYRPNPLNNPRRSYY